VKVSAAVILIQNAVFALINRNRHGRHDFLFPVRMIVAGKTSTKTATHETEAEPGLAVKIKPRIAGIWYPRSPQYNYLAAPTSVLLGSGSGPVMVNTSNLANAGSPIWMDVTHSFDQLVALKLTMEFAKRSIRNTRPEKPWIVTDRQPDAVIKA
jgi:hypothetical protein